MSWIGWVVAAAFIGLFICAVIDAILFPDGHDSKDN